MLCRLAGDLLADVPPPQAVSDGNPPQGPGILGVNRQPRVQAFLPASRRPQQCHCCGHAVQVVLIEVRVGPGRSVERSPGILKAQLEVVAAPHV